MSNLRKMIDELYRMEEERQRTTRTRGRPMIPITEQGLTELLQFQFTQVEIASLYGCSSRTIHRRIIQFGLDDLVMYTDIADPDLDYIVTNFVLRFPSAGQKTLEGFLWSQVFNVGEFEKAFSEWIHGELSKEAGAFYTGVHTVFLGQTVCGILMGCIN